MKLVILLLVILPIPALGQTHFASNLDSSQVVNNPSDSAAIGTALLSLNANQTELTYSLQLSGLDLDPVAINRTDHNDVIAIHIHLHVQDAIGPHILNIFGNPSQDDADLVIDYENESFSGVFDIDDASSDSITGEILPQAFPLTTKLFPTSFRLEELLNEEWYFAVHTAGTPGVTIRGSILIVPEPSSTCLILLGFVSCLAKHNRLGML